MCHLEKANEIDVIIYTSHIDIEKAHIDIEKADEMDCGKAIRGYLVSLI